MLAHPRRSAMCACACAGMLWQWDLSRTLGWAHNPQRAGCWTRFRHFAASNSEEWSFPIPLGATPYYDTPQLVHALPESSNGAFVTTGVAPRHHSNTVNEAELTGPALDSASRKVWGRQWQSAWHSFYNAGLADVPDSDSLLLFGLSDHIN